MRRIVLIVSATFALGALPAAARAQSGNTSVQGFGGMTFGTSSVLGGSSAAPAFGGSLAVGISPNLQIIGEGGRMSDIKPPLLDLLDLTPVDLRVRAWYGEGGLRVIASPQHAVRPYAEATAGFARLSTSVAGFGGGADAIIDTGLNLLDRTEPLLGVGGGIVLQGGPLTLDLGYRYNKIMATGLASAINGGNAYQVNQVRAGIGIRF